MRRYINQDPYDKGYWNKEERQLIDETREQLLKEEEVDPSSALLLGKPIAYQVFKDQEELDLLGEPEKDKPWRKDLYYPPPPMEQVLTLGEEKFGLLSERYFQFVRACLPRGIALTEDGHVQKRWGEYPLEQWDRFRYAHSEGDWGEFFTKTRDMQQLIDSSWDEYYSKRASENKDDE